MIETIFTFAIMYVVNATNVPACAQYVQYEGALDACYNPNNLDANNHPIIYINQDTSRPQDFVLYHEIGHHIFKDNYSPFMFANAEIMADQFGLFIYEKKYPSLANLVREDREKYFTNYCNEDCVNGILSIKLPNLKLHPFEVQI